MTPHLNRLDEMVQLRGHNICLCRSNKIIPYCQIHPLIWSSEDVLFQVMNYVTHIVMLFQMNNSVAPHKDVFFQVMNYVALHKDMQFQMMNSVFNIKMYMLFQVMN